MADTGELTSSSGSFTVTDTKVGLARHAVWPASICLSHELRASRLPETARARLQALGLRKFSSCMQVAAGYVMHVGSMSRGTLKAGDVVSAEVDYVRRQRIVPNHTFTHVLNFALREARTSSPLVITDFQQPC